MKELSLPDYAIWEGTEVDTGSKHMVLLYKGNKPKEYAEYYRKKYAGEGVPLFYPRWYGGSGKDWKTEMMKDTCVIYGRLRGD